MAVEMAKLSLWLVTLHKGRAFTFLDHAIKCGDTLLGLHDPAQLTCFHLRPERPAAQGRVIDYVAEDCARLLERARQRREALEAFTVFDVRDAGQKARLHAEAEATLASVRTLGDLIVGAGLATAGGNENASLVALDSRLEDLAVHVDHAWREPLLRAAEPDFAELRRLALPLLTDRGRREARRPFHWLAEFPEVFLRGGVGVGGGFDAMVGNPPFVGGQKITGLFGDDYRDYAVLHLAEGRRGSADLCAYFFLRAMQLVRPGGTLGLLAVNTIAEGDTRQVGLEALMRAGHTVHAAWPNFQWPGAAAVVASEVHLRRAIDGRLWQGGYRLADAAVLNISAFLSAEDEWSPKPLKANEGKSFQGSIVLGLGFTMSESDAQALIAANPINEEGLFPYLNGEDLNSHPAQKPSRWVINFWDWPLGRTAAGSWARGDGKQRKVWLQSNSVPTDYPGRVAEDFPDLLEIVQSKVKPERLLNSDTTARKFWWRFLRPRGELYHAIGRGGTFSRHPEGWESRQQRHQTVVAIARVSKSAAFIPVPNHYVFSEATVLLVVNGVHELGVLQSTFHIAFAWQQASKLKNDLRYSPSDALDPFPFPSKTSYNNALAEASVAYNERRLQVGLSLDLGVTDVLRLLNAPANNDAALVELRRLHAALDVAVRNAYGWTDLDLGHGFHRVPYLPESDRVRFTISEPARLEVLRRLSHLNRERWQAEQDAAAAALNDVEAARLAMAKPERKAGPGLRLVSATQQPDLF